MNVWQSVVQESIQITHRNKVWKAMGGRGQWVKKELNQHELAELASPSNTTELAPQRK